MALSCVVSDPTDPGRKVNGYVKLVLVNKPAKGVGLGLHAEFLVYRSREAADAGAMPLLTTPIQVDFSPAVFDQMYDFCFSAEALSKKDWNAEAVVYTVVKKYLPEFAEMTEMFDGAQSPLPINLCEKTVDALARRRPPDEVMIAEETVETKEAEPVAQIEGDIYQPAPPSLLERLLNVI